MLAVIWHFASFDADVGIVVPPDHDRHLVHVLAEGDVEKLEVLAAVEDSAKNKDWLS